MLLRTAAHRDANVLRWLGAYAASVTGDLVYFLTLMTTADRLVGPAQAGAVLAAGAAPRALLMLAGGVLADRWGPRRMVISSDLVRCVTVLLATALLLTTDPQLWTLYVVAVVFGVADALFMPAVGAMPPQLTAQSQLGRVQGMRSLAVRVANTVGPPVAALAFALAGVSGAFGVAGALFVVSLALLLFVRVRPAKVPSATSTWTEFREGLRYVRTRSGLLPLTVVIALSEMCFSGPMSLGLGLLIGARHESPGLLAAMFSAFSIGGAISGLAVTVLNRIPHERLTMVISLLLTALLLAPLGWISSAAGVAVSGLLGVTSGVTVVVSYTLLQKIAEPGYLGRVTAVTTLLTLGLSPLILPGVGLVTALWGVSPFFVGCGVVNLIAAVTALAIHKTEGL